MTKKVIKNRLLPVPDKGDLSSLRVMVAELSRAFSEYGQAINELIPKVDSLGLVLLAEATASTSATVDFITGIDSTYRNYRVIITDVQPDATGDDQLLCLRYQESAAWQTTLYDWSQFGHFHGATFGSESLNQNRIGISHAGGGLGLGDQANETGSFIVDILDPASANHTQTIATGWWHDASGANATMSKTGGGDRRSTTPVTGLRFFFSAGNIAQGNFKLYGVI